MSIAQILNNDILETGNQLIQIGGAIAQIENKLIIDMLHSLSDQVNGLNETGNAIEIYVYSRIGIVLLCSTVASFIGPGGKNILNDEPSLAPGVKNTLETKLEQNPILEQKTKEKEKEKENSIALKVAKVRSGPALRQGQQRATILYEKLDINSTTIVTLSRPLPGDIAIGLLGRPSIRRTGIHLDRLSAQGTYIAPENQS
jgi:hypothetical protein